MSIHDSLTINEISPELLQPPLKLSIAQFLFRELGAFRDPLEDIDACLDYILDPRRGGRIFLARVGKDTILSVVLLANTGMKKFVPEFLLVYFATAESVRGQGIGSKMLKYVQEQIKAPVALHVEHENPAKKLYERNGFTSKYAEMRWYP